MIGYRCWTCFGEGVIVRRDCYGKKRVIKCPQCEDRRLIREYKESEREAEEARKQPIAKKHTQRASRTSDKPDK